MMKAKRELKKYPEAKNISINPELTSLQRNVDKKNRNFAAQCKREGKKTAILFQKVLVDVKLFQWSPIENKVLPLTPKKKKLSTAL